MHTHSLLYTDSLLIGITIDQSDLTIQEGSSKDVPIRRSGSLPVNITVFVATIEDYRQFEQTASDNECSITLSRLLNGSEVDSTEGIHFEEPL